MLLDETIKFSDKEIIEKGARALIKELGHAGFLRFIRQFESSGSEDYLKIQDDIYQGLSLDDIFDGASKNWQDSNEKLKKTRTDEND